MIIPLLHKNINTKFTNTKIQHMTRCQKDRATLNAKWLHHKSLPIWPYIPLWMQNFMMVTEIFFKARRIWCIIVLCLSSYQWHLNTDLFLLKRPGLKKSKQSDRTSYNAKGMCRWFIRVAFDKILKRSYLDLGLMLFELPTILP